VLNDPGRLISAHCAHTALTSGWAGLKGPSGIRLFGVAGLGIGIDDKNGFLPLASLPLGAGSGLLFWQAVFYQVRFQVCFLVASATGS